MVGLDHDEMEEWVSAYADGELAAAQREMVELHLEECAVCRRSLAEFRLARQHLALLGDTSLSMWEPNVAARVNARITRRRTWLAFGRGLALNLARTAVLALLVVAGLWLVRHLPQTAPEGDGGLLPVVAGAPDLTSAVDSPTPRSLTGMETIFTATMTAPTPTLGSGVINRRFTTAEFEYTTLSTPDKGTGLYLFRDLYLVQPLAPDAITNLGFRLLSDGDAYLIVEGPDGAQRLVGADQAPSIRPPAGTGPGDQLRLFAATATGETTPAVAFVLIQEEGEWRALQVRELAEPPTLHVTLPTPTVQAVGRANPPPSPAPGSKLGGELRLARFSIDPATPRQGGAYTVSALVRNDGPVAVRVPVWFAAFVGESMYPGAVSPTYYVTVPGNGEVVLLWDGRDGWGAQDVTLQGRRLTFQAGVNVGLPAGRGGPQPSVVPELDKYDNQVELAVLFDPYAPEVSDACLPGDNLRLELGPASGEPGLQLLVTNEGNVEADRVPLQAVNAQGLRSRTYAHRVRPCGGVAIVGLGTRGNLEDYLAWDQMTLPITVTLNDPATADALPETDHGDNVVVVTREDVPCAGPTDLWLADEDVSFDGDDLLVMVHLSGGPPRTSFWLRVFDAADGHSLDAKNLRIRDCSGPLAVRFGGLLDGLADGSLLMVEIDTLASRSEGVYPQENNAVWVPLER